MIQLVPAARAVLHRPELSGLGMERRGLNVAMAVGPDLRSRAVAIDKWIVARRRTIGIDPHYFTDRRRQILRPLGVIEAIAQSHKQCAVGTKDDSRSPMVGAADFGLLAPDHLGIFQPALAEAATRDRGACAALAGLGERDVDQPIFFKGRAQ